MKKISILLILLFYFSSIQSQYFLIRTNIFSHLRPLSTANLNIGILSKSKKIETYLSIEKAYASLESIAYGSLRPDNRKANLEFGIGNRIYMGPLITKKTNFFLIGELEFAKLNYLFKDANKWIVSQNGFFGPTIYDSDGLIHVKRFKFNRTQLLVGMGLQFTITKKLGIDVTLAGWSSNHSSINTSIENQENGGKKIIQDVNELDDSIHFSSISFNETFGSSDEYLDSSKRRKFGVQYGLSFYYIIGK